jgi:hypothetical protein
MKMRIASCWQVVAQLAQWEEAMRGKLWWWFLWCLRARRSRAPDQVPLLNVHIDFPLFQRPALAIGSGRAKSSGIKIRDTQLSRLMEVPLHLGPSLAAWRSAQIHEAIRAAFDPSADAYTLSQLRIDLEGRA